MGGSAVALSAIAAGGTAYVATREPAGAQAPWRYAREGGFGEPRIDALAWAILAPSPHNRQPWLFELVGDDTIIVHCDMERLLPHTDPFGRQIVIGFGCMLELLRMAAAQQGYQARVIAFPEGEPQPRLDDRPIARVRFEPGGVADPLFAQAGARRSNKEVFDTARPVALGTLIEMARQCDPHLRVSLTAEPERIEALRSLTWRAWIREVETRNAYQESIDLMRIGRAEIEASPDGIALPGAMMEVLNRVGFVTRDTLADPHHPAYAQGLSIFEPVIRSAMGYIALVSAANTRHDQLNAGRDWLRLNLAAAGAGIGLHPLSQSLQEFPEMAALHREAHEHIAPQGGTVQMLGRVGYGPRVAPTPRWPVETRIIAV
jgi:hypothetical protein